MRLETLPNRHVRNPGNGRLPCRHPRRGGFTLIELVIVIGVILLLAAILTVKGRQWIIQSSVKSTESVVNEVRLKLQQYHSDFGTYPPDGIDEPLSTPQGTQLRSGAALTFALSQPTRRRNALPNGEWEESIGEPLFKFKSKNLYHDDSDEAATELLDSFGNPFHYDRLHGENSYSVQDDGSVHLSPSDAHGDDPRVEEGICVRTAGPQHPGTYDLWSHGPDGHSKEETPLGVIANWELPEKE